VPSAYHVVLAVKDEREDAFAAARSSILDRCARRELRPSGNPALNCPEDLIMNTSTEVAVSRGFNALSQGLTLEEVMQRAPAVFSRTPHEKLSARYTLIPTDRVLNGLLSAGFVPVAAQQARTKSLSAVHARHVVRLRRRYEAVRLKDAVPEVVFLNSHDGTSAYQLRMGIYRVVCTNGLVVSRGAFPACHVSHRGDVVDDVVAGALQIAEQFGRLAQMVERMEQRVLYKDEQIALAEQAMDLRFPRDAIGRPAALQLLGCRRVEDAGNDLWSVFNRVQENVVAGGMHRRSETGRLTRTRRITSIRENLRLNGALWDLATNVLAA
jgi:hypothetical protein